MFQLVVSGNEKKKRLPIFFLFLGNSDVNNLYCSYIITEINVYLETQSA